MRGPPTPEVQAALADLGVTQATMNGVATAPTLEEARARFDVIRAEGHRRYRRLALELHPDRHGDPARAERLRHVIEAWRLLRTVTIVPVPRPPVVRIVTYSSWSSSATSTNTTGAW